MSSSRAPSGTLAGSTAFQSLMEQKNSELLATFAGSLRSSESPWQAMGPMLTTSDIDDALDEAMTSKHFLWEDDDEETEVRTMIASPAPDARGGDQGTRVEAKAPQDFARVLSEPVRMAPSVSSAAMRKQSSERLGGAGGRSRGLDLLGRLGLRWRRTSRVAPGAEEADGAPAGRRRRLFSGILGPRAKASSGNAWTGVGPH